MKYEIVRTDKADEQLREIIFYIADDSDYTKKLKSIYIESILAPQDN